MFCLGQKLKLQSFQLRLVRDIVMDFLIDVETFESLFKECAKLHASCAFVTYVPIIYVLKCLTCLRVFAYYVSYFFYVPYDGCTPKRKYTHSILSFNVFDRNITVLSCLVFLKV